MRIEEKDGEFLGKVVKILSETDPNPLCERCEGAQRNQLIVGMTILRGLRRESDGFGGGTILDPDEGRIYRCTARLLDQGRKLEVRGYLGLPLFGRTQIWVRAN